MNRKLFSFVGALAIVLALVVLAGCDNTGSDWTDYSNPTVKITLSTDTDKEIITAKVGQTLQAVTTDFSDDGKYNNYQWKNEDGDISGASGRGVVTYTPTVAGTYKVEVTGTKYRTHTNGNRDNVSVTITSATVTVE